jgi:hypothetical protein
MTVLPELDVDQLRELASNSNVENAASLVVEFNLQVAVATVA